MNKLPHVIVLAMLLGLSARLVQAQVAAPAQAQESVRSEIGKPLSAAQELMKAGKHREALARIREADAVPNATPYERFILDRMRGSAAAGAGDDATTIRSFESALSSARLQSAESLPLLEALAGAAYRTKDYPKASAAAGRYFKEGGNSDAMRSLKASADYRTGDYAGVVQGLEQKVQAIEQSVPVVDESNLRMLAASYAKLGNDAGYTATLEKLLVHHPKKEYWDDRLNRLQADPIFADRLLLDLYRLRRATDTLDDADQIQEMAQLALRAALPAEARQVVEAGYAAGKLGSGPDVERHKRLRELATRQAVEDEKALQTEVIGGTDEALVNTGQVLVSAGRPDKGADLIESGLAKGGLKRAEEARLHLGQAYLLAGNRAKAVEAFKAVRGGDGLADLARLWAIQATRP